MLVRVLPSARFSTLPSLSSLLHLYIVIGVGIRIGMLLHSYVGICAIANDILQFPCVFYPTLVHRGFSHCVLRGEIVDPSMGFCFGVVC